MDQLIKQKKQIEEKKSKRDQLLGQKEMIEKELKKHGFSSLKEAKKNLLKQEEEIDTMDIEFEESLNAFEEKYGDLLNESDTDD